MQSEYADRLEAENKVLKEIIIDLYRWQTGIDEFLPEGLNDRIVAVIGNETIDKLFGISR